MFTIIWTSIFSFSVIISFLVQPLRETLSLSLFLVFPSSISVSSSPSSLLHYPHFTFLHSTTLEEVFKTKKLEFLLLLYFQRHRKISKPRLQVESPLSLFHAHRRRQQQQQHGFFSSSELARLLSFQPLQLALSLLSPLSLSLLYLFLLRYTSHSFSIHAYSCSNIDR